MSYGPHIPAWNAVCERLGMAREDMLAQNAFAIDSSGALLARAWPAFGNEQEAVLAVAEWFGRTRMADRKPHARHESGLHIVVVPFGGIYAVAATYEELPPTHAVVAFEPHRKPLLELLAALPPVDGPDTSGGVAAIRGARRS